MFLKDIFFKSFFTIFFATVFFIFFKIFLPEKLFIETNNPKFDTIC
jgi:hypothetical protein